MEYARTVEIEGFMLGQHLWVIQVSCSSAGHMVTWSCRQKMAANNTATMVPIATCTYIGANKCALVKASGSSETQRSRTHRTLVVLVFHPTQW